MSAYPACVMGALCIGGGAAGYARKQSVPSLVAGTSLGLLYLWSGESIRKGTPYGVEGALSASVLLLLSSLPRVLKGPGPVVLVITSSATGLYYGRLWKHI